MRKFLSFDSIIIHFVIIIVHVSVIQSITFINVKYVKYVMFNTCHASQEILRNKYYNNNELFEMK